jgi:hypothetical protein
MLERLRNLAHERPKSKTGQIRWAMADIQHARNAGHDLKTICQRLNELGIEIAYRDLVNCMYRLRKRGYALGQIATTEISPLRSAEKTEVPSSLPQSANAETTYPDPVAALKERLQQRPGFEYNSKPDKSKLI